ncbi:sigma-70 family RNA polymerase sigma factor [Acutalibacter caecimuris]|uniref:sigma-70 family RNA polymerase sigma factor n=1 Tax=Acutalibacter caecimuris TaxID=3093657 RepID=UPI002AC98691|nr:sigma-70 family RNA polymerase sigma factor [Acutalibacter sp. M00118]
MSGPRNNERLAVKAKEGNAQAVLELWERVKLLLYKMAHRFYRRYGADFFARRGATMEDLEQECFLAFLGAVRAYKPAGGWRFTTYLTRASENRFRAVLGMKRNDPLNVSDSLNAPLYSDDADMETGDLIPDPGAESELGEVDERYTARVLALAVCRVLSPVQLEVVRCRFYRQYTRPQTARALGIAQGVVLKEERRAVRALAGDEDVRGLERWQGCGGSFGVSKP